MPNKYLRLIFIVISIGFFQSSITAQKTQYDSPRQNGHDGDEHYLKPTGIVIPAALLLYSGLKPVIKGIHNLDERIYTHVQNTYPDFHTNAEDYLMWVPSGSVYVMDAFSVPVKHTFKEHLILDAGSILVTGGIGYGMRQLTKNSNEYTPFNTKFPSGHVANAFRGAELFHQELKTASPVLSYGGYVIATTVGVLRILNKSHEFTQVLAGAGLGMLSTRLTYWIFNKVKYGKERM